MAETTNAISLHVLGNKIIDSFNALANITLEKAPFATELTKKLFVQAQRFTLWAASLGLQQQGHASLDYRLRDAIVVRKYAAEVLNDLVDNLDNIRAVLIGERCPYELDDAENVLSTLPASSPEPEIFEHPSIADSHSSLESSDGVEGVEGVLRSSASSEKSFHEIPFRLQSLVERVDALYSLAIKIRNPINRPARPTLELYKHVPADQRVAYMHEREHAETDTVAYVQRQQLAEAIKVESESALSLEDLFNCYVKEQYWLIQRTGIANARRKQQFVYWKEHAELIAQNVPVEKGIATESQPGERESRIHQVAVPSEVISTLQAAPDGKQSLATSATKLDPNAVKPDDLKSVISHHSRVSTMLGPQGEKVDWPLPPSGYGTEKFFNCPYCKMICPQRYLSKDAWRVHLIYDLQPYHCTYKFCADPHRLYSSRQEWINHESQHTRVWHCAKHQLEFETRPEYIVHLKDIHPQSGGQLTSPELVSASMGPSLKPHRDCPFCPTAFSEVLQMQKHIAYHLERFALFALHSINDPSDDEQGQSGRSSDTKQANPRKMGRQGSILADFGSSPPQIFEDFDAENSVEREVRSTTFQKIRDQTAILSELGLRQRVISWLATHESETESVPSSMPPSIPPPRNPFRNPRGSLVVDYSDEPPAAPTKPYFTNLPFSRDTL